MEYFKVGGVQSWYDDPAAQVAFSRELIQQNISFSPEVIPDTVMSASDFGRRGRSPRVEIPFLYMDLYPTDCLSIGYFVRRACELIHHEIAHVYLNLSSSLLKAREIKALSQELCRPIATEP
jgi:hypothetical protein